jgi:hypothetical protein
LYIRLPYADNPEFVLENDDTSDHKKAEKKEEENPKETSSPV